MTLFPRKPVFVLGLGLLIGLLTSNPEQLCAQAPSLTPFSMKDTQRSALNQVRGQVKWLQNATRTATRSPAGGYDVLGRQYQTLCASFDAFKRSLAPAQLDSGANDLAELDAGLGIIGEAFGIYQQELASGRSSTLALRDLCTVLRDAIGLWLQELNRSCARLRIGRP
jgi:hypothetical protein